MHIHQLAANALLKQAFAGGITSGTQTGTGIDTLGYRRLAFASHLKTGTATTVTVKVQESSDNSTFTDVATSSQPATPLAASSEGVYLTDVDMAYHKRYIRVAVVGTGTAGDVEVLAFLFDSLFDAPTQDATPLAV